VFVYLIILPLLQWLSLMQEAVKSDWEVN